MSEPKRYLRTQASSGSGVIHRADCPMLIRAKHLQEWDWPEGKELEELVAEMRARGVQDHFCRMCFPRNDDDSTR